jgi:hypothetical protein
MWKKNYINEITDAFGSEIDPKDALKLAKNIKESQYIAYPSTKYKEKLFTKLENVYLVDQAGDMPPRFSLFQIFWAFASFVFIAGTTFVVFDFRENAWVPVYENVILEESFKSKITPTQNDEQQQFIPEEIVDEVGEENIVDVIPQNISPQSPFLKDTWIADEQESLPVSEIQQKSRDSEDLRWEEAIESDSIFPSSSGMMMEDMWSLQRQEMNFIGICSEFNGTISEDELFCILSDGTVCEEHNIYDCAEQDTQIWGNENIDINLEELIQEYGQ